MVKPEDDEMTAPVLLVTIPTAMVDSDLASEASTEKRQKDTNRIS
jgi:hypothetical protein